MLVMPKSPVSEQSPNNTKSFTLHARIFLFGAFLLNLPQKEQIAPEFPVFGYKIAITTFSTFYTG